MKQMKPKCQICGGTGKTEGVWYGRPTGKMTKCQICGGTGSSSAVNIFDL